MSAGREPLPLLFDVTAVGLAPLVFRNAVLEHRFGLFAAIVGATTTLIALRLAFLLVAQRISIQATPMPMIAAASEKAST